MWLLILGIFVILIILGLPRLLDLRRMYIRFGLSMRYGLQRNCQIVAFFHPYCTSGGGGERVLWTAVKGMLSVYREVLYVVYTNDSNCFINKQSVFDSVERTFSLSLQSPDQQSRIHFVRLRTEKLLSPRLYPIFTLLGQALGSMLVAIEALFRCPPDIFIDTTGYGFTLPLAKWMAGAKTAAYVHYPTISSDMTKRISETSKMNTTVCLYNNSTWIRNSRILSRCKLIYYNIFTYAYKWCGSVRNVQVVMTNSSWTQKHILSLWGGKPVVLYPPCPTRDLADQTFSFGDRKPWILSVGQFRPEKDHELQLKAFRLFLERLDLLDKPEQHQFRLQLVGGCRDTTDLDRVNHLKEMAASLKMVEVIEFHLNLPYSTLRRYFHECTINLHTMLDEHFGIGIVEGMASGLITVSHNSGGPRMDIIGPNQCHLPSRDAKPKAIQCGVGYLATSAEDYADVFEYVLLRMSDEEKLAIQKAAQKRAVEKFSEESFIEGWLEQMTTLEM